MKLSPAEQLALSEITRAEGRMTGAELGEKLDLSERSGRRILRSLVRKGALVYVRRGRYALAAERSEVAVERPNMAVSIVPTSNTTTSRSVLLPDPNGSYSKGASHPLMGSGTPGKISDTSGDGWDEFDPDDRTSKRKRKPKGKLRLHRLTPREEWTMQHVVQEFALRAHYAYPDRLYPSDGRTLTPALNDAASKHEMSPQFVAEAIDVFFDSAAKNLPPTVTPNQGFLTFLDRYYTAQSTNVTDDDLDEIRRRGEERI